MSGTEAAGRSAAIVIAQTPGEDHQVGLGMDDCLVVVTPGYTGGPLIRVTDNRVHLRGVVVMPRGEERLAPTIRRTTRAAWLRAKHQVRRRRVPLAVAAAVVAAAGVTLGVRR